MRVLRVLALLAVALAVAVPVLFSPRGVLACSCAVVPDLAAPGNADTVFSGTVLEIGAGWAGGSSMAPKPVSFAVDRVWIGNVPARATVTTASSGASCGYERFAVGGRFIVYAVARGEEFETDLCTPTRPYDEASVAVVERVFGPGDPVAAPIGDGPPFVPGIARDDGGSAWLVAATLGSLLVIVAAAGAGWWHWGRER